MRSLGWLVLVGAGLSAAAQESFEVRDRGEFAKVFGEGAKVEKLASGMRFVEGPVWFDSADGGFLVFSDIPNNKLMRWSAKEGLSVFREKSNQANGNTRDLEGRLVTCEHFARRVSSTDMKSGGEAVTLVDRVEGKKFNSPNDVVVRSDGTVWFTDPTYGGHKDLEVGSRNVYRFDPKTRAVTAVVRDFDQPNGLAFSPDEKRLYVADSGRPKHIRVFELRGDGTVGEGKVFCAIDKGVPDGIRVDAEGRVWSSARDGVHVFTAEGKLIGKVLLPENCANLCFGGREGDEVYMTATTSVYRVKVRGR